ncbi:LLM class flavin-dependent oxidoreductase [Thermogemmatispora sp.]|uniref:LLM class flavin-dependent oxidoreductase n=1 Tax=Thermogemmatispora sp. TaxID=1968838 RepID=UPI0035E44994
MSRVEFGLMLQMMQRPPLEADELWDYNQRLIQAAEGFSTIWVEDHFDWGEAAVMECFSTMCYVAARYPHLKVGSLVLGQGYRNPALLAKMAANLQLMSGGRLILGLGAGWQEHEYRSYGYHFPPVKERMEQLEEAIHILRLLWQGGPATFVGRHYRIEEAHCLPAPRQPIPLLIGGGGEQRTLAITARYADLWNFNSCTLEEYSRKLAILHQHCQRLGRNPAEITLTYLSTASVADDPTLVARDPKKHFIAGSPAEVIRELEQFIEVGVSHFIFRFLDIPSLERFARSVVPHFR